MRLVNRLCLIVGLGCLLAACGTAPTPTATPAAQFERILLESFNDKKNNWINIDVDEKGQANYAEDQQYRIKVTKSKTHIFTFPVITKNQSLADVTVAVEAKKENGDSNNLYGVICRHKNQENFYFFVVSSDGYFGIGKVVKGKYQLINRSDYPPSDAVLKDVKTNRIRAECIGSRLSLYVNDQWVDEQIDTDLTSGKVGIIAGTLGGETTILFDEFEIRGPKP